jgi:hypothetical protein
MEYAIRHVGGPLDGSRRNSDYGARYITTIGSQPKVDALLNMAVYDYRESHVSGDVTERIYHFRMTVPIGEIREYLKDAKTIG